MCARATTWGGYSLCVLRGKNNNNKIKIPPHERE